MDPQSSSLSKSRPSSLSLEDRLTCAICLERYSDPRALPCQHSFSAACIQGLCTKGPSFPCPLCREVIESKKEYPANFTLNSFLELASSLIPPASESSSPSPSGPSASLSSCDLCVTETKALVGCRDCGKLLCKLHEDAHKSTKTTVSHTLLAVDDAIKLRKRAQHVVCTLHEDEPRDTCCRLVCRDCTVLDHRTHEVMQAQKAAEKQRKELAGLLERASKMQIKMEAKLFEACSKEEKTLKEIEQRKEEIRQMFLKLERKLVAKVEEPVMPLQVRKKSLECNLGLLSSARDFAAAALHVERSSHELLSILPSLKPPLLELLGNEQKELSDLPQLAPIYTLPTDIEKKVEAVLVAPVPVVPPAPRILKMERRSEEDRGFGIFD